MKRECFWAYPILRENGITVDVSVVPAPRDHGGIDGFSRDPILLHTEAGALTVFPLSILSALGRRVPFSGGGYLRLFSMPIIKYGFRQNHRAGRPVMTYIHPREIDPQQPRLELPRMKGFKYYVNIATTEEKLRTLLKTYRFGTCNRHARGRAIAPGLPARGRRHRPDGSQGSTRCRQAGATRCLDQAPLSVLGQVALLWVRGFGDTHRLLFPQTLRGHEEHV